MIKETPLPPDIEDRLTTLEAALARDSRIRFAYLCGSAGRREMTPLSDIDVAVYLDPSAGLEAGPDVREAVARHLTTEEVDVIVLNTAPTALAGRLLADATIVLDRDPFLRHRFESQARRAFHDFRFLEHRTLAERFNRG